MNTSFFYRKAVIAAVFLSLCFAEAKGQALKLNIDSTTSVQFGFNVQTWGSIDLQTSGTRFTNFTTPEKVGGAGDWEILIRRAMFSMTAIIAKDNYIFFHIGTHQVRFNSITPGNAPFFIHDLSYQRVFTLSKELEFVAGAGVHYYMGPNRLSVGSPMSISGLDLPSSVQPLGTVQLVALRAIGVFTAGAIGPVNYRVSLNQPFAIGAPALTTLTPTSIATLNSSWAPKEITGYVYYQMFAKESIRTAVAMGVGTTLGAARKLNFGIGGLWVGNNAFTKKTETAAGQGLTYHDTWGISADAYADMPFGEKDELGGITAYTLYSYYNFGPHYARVDGTDNSMILTGHNIVANVLLFTGKLLPINLGLFAEVAASAPTSDGNPNNGKFWTRYDVGLSWFAYKSNVRIDLAYRNASAATASATQNTDGVINPTIAAKAVNDFDQRRDRLFLAVRVAF